MPINFCCHKILPCKLSFPKNLSKIKTYSNGRCDKLVNACIKM